MKNDAIIFAGEVTDADARQEFINSHPYLTEAELAIYDSLGPNQAALIRVGSINPDEVGQVTILQQQGNTSEGGGPESATYASIGSYLQTFASAAAAPPGESADQGRSSAVGGTAPEPPVAASPDAEHQGRSTAVACTNAQQ